MQKVRNLLTRYFDLMERITEMSGYARLNILHPHWMYGHSGHRILTIDIPAKMRRVGVAIQALPAPIRDAVIAKHGVYRDAQGRMIQNRQKAEMLGIGLDTFRSRVRTGERRLMFVL